MKRHLCCFFSALAALSGLLGCSQRPVAVSENNIARNVHQAGVILCDDFQAADNSCTSLTVPQSTTNEFTIFSVIRLNSNNVKISYVRKLNFTDGMACETLTKGVIENYFNGMFLHVAGSTAARITNADMPLSPERADAFKAVAKSQVGMHEGEVWCQKYTYTNTANDNISVDTYVNGKLQPAPKPMTTTLFKVTALNELHLRSDG